MKEKTQPKTQSITITPLNFKCLEMTIIGTAPYMQARFGAKAMQAMRAKQEAGSTARKGTKREARDFAEDFKQAIHVSSDGWVGIPAPAVRNAMIRACAIVGFKMTQAKMSVFCESDGLDAVDGSPLVKLDAGDPEQSEMTVRNATGVVDIRVRPMWREWQARVRIRFDADQFTPADVYNLLMRAGEQVGIGEGRPFSKDSAGLGFGTFTVDPENVVCRDLSAPPPVHIDG